MNAWNKLTEIENNIIWDTFETQFAFRPSVHEEEWPGIQEPIPSITYCISQIFNQGEQHYNTLIANLMEVFLHAFTRLVPQNDWIYALDWHHSGYKFYPHRPFALNEFGEWPVPILPNGDYYVFLDEHLRFGVFGHTWEQTMCIFGEPLLVLLEHHTPNLFTEKLRINGKRYHHSG